MPASPDTRAGGRRKRGPSQRQLRVGEEIRHALSHVFGRGSFRDPALRDVPITITEVRIGPDLRKAKVFVARLGGGDIDDTVTALSRAQPYLRRLLAAEVQLKFLPVLEFSVDRSLDEASRVDRLLRSPEVARDLDSQTGPESGTQSDFEEDNGAPA